MDQQEYWKNKHIRYSKAEWIDDPSLFAKTAIKYFPKTAKILDLGAGQGQDSRFFAKKSYEVLSTDFSDFALKLSTQKTTDKNLKIEWQKLDLSQGNLPFMDDSINIVYANLSLHYFSDDITYKLFCEIFRILKKDGIFAMLLNSVEDPEIAEYEYIGDGLYQDPDGLAKRYFSVEYLQDKVEDKFKTLLLDDAGKIYHLQKFQKLIRYIGRK